MWKKSKSIFLISLLLSVPQLSFSQSPKDTIINELTRYQNSLLNLNLLIQNSQKQISDLQNQVSDLEKELENSKNKSQEIILEIKKELEISKRDLSISQMALSRQKTLLQESLKELNKLKNSLRVYKTTTYILLGVSAVSIGYAILRR